MTRTPLQSKTYGSIANSGSHSVTLTSTPTSGNLLILCVASDTTVSGTPSGWSVVASAVDFGGVYMYYKVAGASEPATASVSLSASDTCALLLYEYTGNSSSSPLDKSATAVAQASPCNTGTTATTTQPSELIIAYVGLTGADGTNVAPTVSSWDNSFIQLDSVTSSGGTNARAVAASKMSSATGTFTANATLNKAGTSHNSGIIATFLPDPGPVIGTVPSGTALTTPAFTAKFLFFDTGDFSTGV